MSGLKPVPKHENDQNDHRPAGRSAAGVGAAVVLCLRLLRAAGISTDALQLRDARLRDLFIRGARRRGRLRSGRKSLYRTAVRQHHAHRLHPPAGRRGPFARTHRRHPLRRPRGRTQQFRLPCVALGIEPSADRTLPTARIGSGPRRIPNARRRIPHHGAGNRIRENGRQPDRCRKERTFRSRDEEEGIRLSRPPYRGKRFDLQTLRQRLPVARRDRNAVPDETALRPGRSSAASNGPIQ